MKIIRILSFNGFLVLALISCGRTSSTRHYGPQTIINLKDTCDDPDADIRCCFLNMPAKLTSTMRIAQEEEAGEELIISGTFFRSDGRTPYPDVILYAYHTDSTGHYSKNGSETGVQKWHGRLHGWCKTDELGHYEILTIRPAPYPDRSMPAHIHVAIKTNTGQMEWITDLVFMDDPLVNGTYLSSLSNVGGTGVVDIKRSNGNIWTGKRDIVMPHHRDRR